MENVSKLSGEPPKQEPQSLIECILSRLKNITQEQSTTLSSINNKLNIILSKEGNNKIADKAEAPVKPKDKCGELNIAVDNLEAQHNWLMTLNNHLSEII